MRFIRGLKTAIRSPLIAQRIQVFQDAVDRAYLIEQDIGEHKRKAEAVNPGRQGSQIRTQPQSRIDNRGNPGGQSAPRNPGTISGNQTNQDRRLCNYCQKEGHSEDRCWRKQGKCTKCGQLGHFLRKRQRSIMGNRSWYVTGPEERCYREPKGQRIVIAVNQHQTSDTTMVTGVDAKVVILYDIFGDSRASISAPLPLLLRGLPKFNISSSQSTSNVAESLELTDSSDTETVIYGDNWIFLVPDLICDVAKGALWKIHLDLEAISASSSEAPLVFEFLQRRKLEVKKAKQLCLAIARSIIIEGRPLPVVVRAIEVLVTSYSFSVKMGNYLKGGLKTEKTSTSSVFHANSTNTGADESISREGASRKSIKGEPSDREERETINRASYLTLDSEDHANFEKLNIKFPDSIVREALAGTESPNTEDQSVGSGEQPLNTNVSEQHESLVTSAAVAPDELYSFVFAPVEEEMVGDSSYLIAIIIEFLRSANLEKVKVHPNIYVLMIRLLARNVRYAELGLFVINKILEPSKEVALQLLESGRQNFQTRKLGLDMLRQLLLHHDYVVLLVQDRYYLEALRYARKNKVNTVRPSLFLQAAYASNDSQHLAAVLRFLCEFIPGFNNTSDHSTYGRILAAMNLSVSV